MYALKISKNHQIYVLYVIFVILFIIFSSNELKGLKDSSLHDFVQSEDEHKILNYEEIIQDKILLKRIKNTEIKDFPLSLRTLSIKKIKMLLIDVIEKHSFECVSALQIGLPYNIVLVKRDIEATTTIGDECIDKPPAGYSMYINTKIIKIGGEMLEIYEISPFDMENKTRVQRYKEIHTINFYDENMHFFNTQITDMKKSLCLQHYTII